MNKLFNVHSLYDWISSRTLIEIKLQSNCKSTADDRDRSTYFCAVAPETLHNKVPKHNKILTPEFSKTVLLEPEKHLKRLKSCYILCMMMQL